MDHKICRQDVIMPGGVELTHEAEAHVGLGPSATVLSVACGTGELELYLAQKYECHVVGIDLGEDFIRTARDKSAARKLTGLATFAIADGNALPFEKASFDVILCSGALCAFFDRGIREFHRVLGPGGRLIVTDVIWRTGAVPKAVRDWWTDGTADIRTLKGNCAAFADRGFHVLFSRAYHEPSWWDAYYADRGTAPHWIEEHRRYRLDQRYLGLGLFVLEKMAT